MDRSLTRRDFLKVVMAGAGASAVLSGCGAFYQGFIDPGSRGAVATTCGECPAGCGLLAYPAGGSLHLAGNPAYPLQPPRGCPGLELAVEKLVSPLRFTSPLRQYRSAEGEARPISWDEAVRAVASVFRRYRPSEVAFVLGLFPDHLNDLVQMLAASLGGANVLRFDPLGELEGRVTLLDASQRLFGVSKTPYFDCQNSTIIYSFGSSFQESWLPAATGKPGYLVQFDEYGSSPTAWADERVQIRPGSQAVLAQTLADLVAGLKDGSPLEALHDASLDMAVEATGMPVAELWRLARLFFRSERKLALPGSTALASATGPEAALAILRLNILVENLGQPGGLFLAPEAPLYPWLTSRPSTVAEMQGLVERMLSGQIKVLFVHGVDLVAALPEAFGLRQAVSRLERVFSFAPLPDETSCLADLIIPDRLALEAWGYQKSAPGCDRPVVSALQPAVQPREASRATADVLLAAYRMAGGSAEALPFVDELDFLKKSVFKLANRDGLYHATDSAAFWQLWREQGGWWRSEVCLIPPVQVLPLRRLQEELSPPLIAGSDELPFRLKLVPTLPANDKLQVQIHPQAARSLGLRNGSLVKLVSPAGQVQAAIRLNSGLAVDALAMPGSSKTPALNHRGAVKPPNPFDLLGTRQNSSGNLDITNLRVRIEPA